MLQWHLVVAGADFGNDTPVNLNGQTVLTGGSAGEVIKVRVRTTNSTGTTFSTVKTVTLV